MWNAVKNSKALSSQYPGRLGFFFLYLGEVTMTDSGVNLQELKSVIYKHVENPFTQSVVPNLVQSGNGNELDEEMIIQQFRPILEEQARQNLNNWTGYGNLVVVPLEKYLQINDTGPFIFLAFPTKYRFLPFTKPLTLQFAVNSGFPPEVPRKNNN